MHPRFFAPSLTPAFAAVQVAVGVSYFALAKLGLMLALVHPSASAVWPATGFALAAVLLWGVRIAPAIFVGAVLANAAANPLAPAFAIAAGNTAEALLGAYLIDRWSNGRRTFETPTGIAIFALVVALFATPISATAGVAALWMAGSVPGDAAGATWLTWWLGNLAGAIVVAPVVVLWLREPRDTARDLNALPALALTGLLGFIAFSPQITAYSGPGLFSFVALVPLLWAALRGDQRNTATVSLTLAAAAVGATVIAPDMPNLNDVFLMVLVFIVSTALPSLALSAAVSLRRKAEDDLRQAHEELEAAVEKRTAELLKTNSELRTAIAQKNALQATNEQQNIQLIEAQRIANLGSWSWNVKTGAVTWSPQLHEIYGVTPESFGGTVDDFMKRLHPDDRAALSETIANSLKTGQGFRTEERIVRPDGSMRHLESCGEVVKDQDGNITEFLGICRDVTAEKNTTRALRDSEEQLRLLVNGIHDYAIYMLDPKGHIVSWNAGAERIKNYLRGEVLGEHFSLFYTPEDKAANMPRRALETAASEGRYEGEGWRVRRDGTRFWANVVIDAIYDSDGVLVGYGKITRDVTEKRQGTLDLEAARDQLAQAQKMEAIGQVTGGVSHDFNNLLAALISSLQLLEKRLPTDPQARRLLQNALDAAERGASLTQRLLTFSRRQNLNPEIVDVPKLVGGMMDLLRRAIGPAVTVETATTGRETHARVDPTQLELAIFNLALNARDAMQGSGTLSVEIDDHAVTETSTSGELQPGRYVRIAVKDTGAGMDERTLRRAAEPFFTTKGVGKGTGLGLSMVQGLTAQSGGALTIDSTPGSGTSVTMWLPASDERADPVEPKPQQPAETTRRYHVLVVDDDPLVAMGTVAMLEDLGHSVVEASSGSQALLALETDEHIDIVITDHAMPGMTGTELAGRIRELDPTMPIILATGWAELTGEVANLPRLSKPYRQEDLAAAIAKSCEPAART